ncbi:NtaA/DmoA family FMN-dependent monooxygenase [Roseomonas terrae]|uniref:NtaA/DmoA family FMN-dependent monooxygenase n=1 Tax=Neoroseomonas terrae TaxID=424799 RepID=A0ABS5EGP4_9PROT|nr:NtaA/DmoA family FMN-dependent monooxygenase [Neoroseomonas terrae]MBR0650191.1 NtaA/DmoA family FMN-dependent monooxygenase [Neoroseomonas terrae]
MPRPFHLGWFVGNSFGVHGWNQPWTGRSARDWAKPDLQIDLARAIERACFDFLMMEDSLFVPDNYGGSTQFYLERALRAPKNDPMPLVSVLAYLTKNLGIVPTISTSFYPPYLLARQVATLDLMSEGRIGCNFVTSTAERAAQNFGMDAHLEHHARYEMAAEFVDVVKQLWGSWEPDAVVMDEERGIFVDPCKVRTVDYKGRFFASRGPLNTARSPQGQPVLMQAGGSPQGRAFAAKHIDVVLAAFNSVPEMKAFRADMRKRVAAEGRDPDSCKVVFMMMPTLGETEQEAKERLQRKLAAKDAAPEVVLAGMSSLTDIDFAQFDLDTPLAELTTNGQQGTLRQFLAQGSTLREIVRNYSHGYDRICGTPDSVASQMIDIIEEVGGDGYIIAGPLNRRYVMEVTEGLVPVLQKRGAVRSAYSHAHFRDNMMEF